MSDPTGLIDVGRLTLPVAVPPQDATPPQDDSPSPSNPSTAPPKVNGHNGPGHGVRGDAHLSVSERLSQKRRQRGQQGSQGRDQGQGQAEPAQDQQQDPSPSPSPLRCHPIDVPLDFSLDLIYELTHNQRQYRPDKETGGVNVSILHLPEVVGTSLGRIKAKVPIRCGIAPIVNACVDWGLKGLGQYPAVQRLLWLKAMFNEREEAHRQGYEEQVGLARSRSGRSLYGLRGQCLQEIFRDFPAGLPESKWRENIYMPMDTYTDLKEVMVGGLGLEIQDAAVLATMYTLADVGECEATKDVTVEEDRLEMKATIGDFLDHVQVRGEAIESMMRGWGMLEDKEGKGDR